MYPPQPSVVKIADFGLARKIERAKDDGKMTHVGTPFWAAPEMITHAAYSEKADVYSFGIVLWELVAREDPYKVCISWDNTAVMVVPPGSHLQTTGRERGRSPVQGCR